MGTWKCDTGFKSGYLVKLEHMLEAKTPGCGLKASPHIESRVKTLKKQAIAIAEMFSVGSGFSWNDVDKMVVAEKDVFDLWVKSHPTARGLRNKPFPHYDTLLEIFGKDRANGLGATTPAAEEEAIESTEATAANDIDQSIAFEEGLDGIDFSSTQPQPLTQRALQQKTRKSTDGWIRGMLEVSSSINKLVDGTMVYLDKIGNALTEESNSNKLVAEELRKIDGLTTGQLMRASERIIGCASLTNLFLSGIIEERKDMVMEVLRASN
ncbi:hypothetical protein L1049_021734 [Liquidambar formosana]|uniref:Myb/SANT-like domain-containing protein n=1 Tax=Liquidambar formosana TaxID=63359 RepID=A0AAP0RCN6_LIQFO